MTTTTNGYDTRTVLVPMIESADVRADLDVWDTTIIDLDAALRDAASARAILDELAVTLDRIEATRVLDIAGPNAEVRKARLTLELADDPCYVAALARQRDARAALADADRRVIVAKERCRLLRSTLSLSSITE